MNIISIRTKASSKPAQKCIFAKSVDTFLLGLHPKTVFEIWVLDNFRGIWGGSLKRKHLIFLTHKHMFVSSRLFSAHPPSQGSL